MKILLTHAYYLCGDKSELKIMKPYPPLGILYISSYLKAEGFDVTLFDSTFSSFEEQKKFISDLKPDIIGIYCNLMTKLNVIPLIKFIKTELVLKESLVVVGGPEPPHHAEKFLAVGADVVVDGEGEETMKEICDSILKNEKDFSTINGVIFKDLDGTIVKTTAREKLKNIDLLPFPDRDGIDLGLYMSAWKKAHRYSSVSVNTMRGCPYTCKWCSHSVYGMTYRRRSPVKTADEINDLVNKYNPDMFWFVDDVFTISHKWLFELENILRERNINIKFECITRSDRLNEEVITSLKNLGCYRVWIGAESGSQKVLDLMDRRVQSTQVREMIKLARKQGIETGTFIMLGYPGEEKKDIIETVNHLKDSNPDIFLTTVAYPIKGTTLYNEIESKLIFDNKWEEMTDRDIRIPGRYSDKFYKHANRFLVNEVNFHKMRHSGKTAFADLWKTFFKAKLSRLIFALIN